ncbi:MAG: nitrite reductase [Thalassobius sp.]|nr:nitrite reductase [Thalassovita sp.]
MNSESNLTISKAAQKDIEELGLKIKEYEKGNIPEDKFKLFRLTRGVYGQRQPGVQMIRIKIPYGKVTTKQLEQIAFVSDKYTNGNLHLTTRQDIQLHYVKVNDSPALWADLEQEDITLREACGNTVRNITGSAAAGIDPNEAFDVSPYAHKLFEFFLRNPICQEMGRKFKIAFSSSDDDSAFTYFHDLGVIPRVKTIDGETVKGFKVVIAGGLGALSMVAHTVHEFLPEEELLPFAEALVRVFDRHGERASRNKARMKFLAKKIGIDTLVQLVKEEAKAVKAPREKLVVDEAEIPALPQYEIKEAVAPINQEAYNEWLATNVFEQKQKGFYGVYLVCPLGNISSDTSRKLADLVRKYAADDIRVTVNQNLLLKFVKQDALTIIFNELYSLDLHYSGYNSIADITACPGTDTCNLGVSNSTALSTELEKVVREEFPELVRDTTITIKISGCMNSCGQHMAASIGFHGSSIKNGAHVIPAMQIVLGGGVNTEGVGYVAEKIIKLPTKRIPEALRIVLNNYFENSEEGEYFNEYVRRQGRRYFYDELKTLADLNTLQDEEYSDWGSVENFELAVGVGECAGVIFDMIGSIIQEGEEKISLANESFTQGQYADAIYHNYNVLVISAKALLLSDDYKCNTQISIMQDFDTHYVSTGKVSLPVEGSFEDFVLQLKQNEPTKEFAEKYLSLGKDFFNTIKAYRANQLAGEKQVIGSYYKA